jgi:hypothetical protein
VGTLDLFPRATEPQRNLLPRDGEVYDHGAVYDPHEAGALFAALRAGVPFQPDELVIAGKRVVSARLTDSVLRS